MVISILESCIRVDFTLIEFLAILWGTGAVELIFFGFGLEFWFGRLEFWSSTPSPPNKNILSDKEIICIFEYKWYIYINFPEFLNIRSFSFLMNYCTKWIERIICIGNDIAFYSSFGYSFTNRILGSYKEVLYPCTRNFSQIYI